MANAGSKRKGATSRSKSGAPKRAAEWLERLFPEADEQGGTAFADRQARRKTAHKMEQTFERAIGAFDAIEKAIDEDKASGEQREWEDRDRRRESDEHARQREESRKDIRLFVEVEERRRALRHRDVLLGLTVLTVVAAIVLAFLAVKHKEPGYAGVSVFSTVLSGCWVYLLRAVQPKDEAARPPAPVAEAQPFRWSVLDFQVEVEEGDGEAERGA
ncbi:MAG: hypothetical protein ACTHN7_06990 [Solirubrobacterales bacterium]